MASLTLDRITKIYNKGVKALDDVTIEVNDKEFFIVLGPSGSGKTTTIRIAAGLETPTSGKVFLDEKEITDYPPKDRDIAMVFQSYALYPFLNVRNNIAFPLKARKMNKKDIDAKVEEVAKLLQIEDLLDRKPEEISGGQRQRVALGRALVRDAKVYLMDEPLSNLDAKLRSSMRVELKNLQKRLEITVVYVTHDQLEALTLGDRLIVINHGKVIQEGKPEDVFNNPKTPFVAGFLGDPPMNFLKGTVNKDDPSEVI
ncbi:MAG: ABC transporter ATP-binding protein, partial [Thermoplasmata archaeon]